MKEQTRKERKERKRTVSLFCERKEFVNTAKKDGDFRGLASTEKNASERRRTPNVRGGIKERRITQRKTTLDQEREFANRGVGKKAEIKGVRRILKEENDSSPQTV